MCFNVDNILNALQKEEHGEVRGDSNKLKLWNICEISHIRFTWLINPVLHSEDIYLTLYTKLEAISDTTVVEVTARRITDLNYLGQDKLIDLCK